MLSDGWAGYVAREVASQTLTIGGRLVAVAGVGLADNLPITDQRHQLIAGLRDVRELAAIRVRSDGKRHEPVFDVAQVVSLVFMHQESHSLCFCCRNSTGSVAEHHDTIAALQVAHNRQRLLLDRAVISRVQVCEDRLQGRRVIRFELRLSDLARQPVHRTIESLVRTGVRRPQRHDVRQNAAAIAVRQAVGGITRQVQGVAQLPRFDGGLGKTGLKALVVVDRRQAAVVRAYSCRLCGCERAQRRDQSFLAQRHVAPPSISDRDTTREPAAC